MAKSSTGGSVTRKERYSNCCWVRGEDKRSSNNYCCFGWCVCGHVTCVFTRWSRSELTRFGLNSEFWPDHPRLTNTHSSKVNIQLFQTLNLCCICSSQMPYSVYVLCCMCVCVSDRNYWQHHGRPEAGSSRDRRRDQWRTCPKESWRGLCHGKQHLPVFACLILPCLLLCEADLSRRLQISSSPAKDLGLLFRHSLWLYRLGAPPGGHKIPL